MSMKIVNKTFWNTKDLRKLFHEVCKHEGVTTHRTIEIVPSKRSGNYSGLGSFRRNWVRLRVPAKAEQFVIGNDGKGQWIGRNLENPDSQKIAQILIHEIGHNQTLHHKDMANCWNFDCEWAKAFLINKTITKPKLPVDLKAKRHKCVLVRIKDKEAKVKRLQNQLKKLYKKKKYYEKIKPANAPYATLSISQNTLHDKDGHRVLP